MKKIILSIAAIFALSLFSSNASAQTTYHGYTNGYGTTTVTGSNGYRSTSILTATATQQPGQTMV